MAFLRRNMLLIGAAGAFLVAGGLILTLWPQGRMAPQTPTAVPAPPVATYPEISNLQELLTGKLTFGNLAEYFADLAAAKGARYALAVLREAPLPPNTDLHLLGHRVGDILYKQEGASGISACTEDFRNSCSHSIVIGLLLDQDEGALAEIAQACRRAPGGSGAYTMCFHGLGHGVLAYSGYNLERAAAFCQKFGTPRYQYEESKQCVGGTIMEMISGVHNPALWEKERPKYFRADDPLSPCTNERIIPREASYWCYVYLTPHLFQVAGADLGRPEAKDFKTAFPFCGRIPSSDPASRDACYGGFGKEFVVLAKARDIRKIEEMSDGELARVYEWCRLADQRDGTAACVVHAMQSLFWGGENERTVATRFCNLITEPYDRSSCFMHLIGVVGFYIQERGYRQEFCAELPQEFRGACKQRLSL